MTEYTIVNDYVLPSEGKVYGPIDVKPNVTLRSMTTAEEMRRLNHSERQYKLLAEIIDECITTPLGISAYDLCVADFQFLLHKLRIVTYGPSYKLSTTCPWCTSQNENLVNMDELVVKPFNAEIYEKYSEFELPVTKSKIKLRMQTPRMMDDIKINAKDLNCYEILEKLSTIKMDKFGIFKLLNSFLKTKLSLIFSIAYTPKITNDI